VHELSMAIELYRTCRAEVDARGGGRLASAGVTVGELSAVEPDLLRFAWSAVVSDNDDRGAELDIEWREAVQRCVSCGVAADRPPGEWLLTCSGCGGTLSIEGGRELELCSVTFEDDSPVVEVDA